MSTVVEVRPGEGGEDAEQFATELTSAISRALAKQNVFADVSKMRLRVTDPIPHWL
jgi:protein subunit release factor A